MSKNMKELKLNDIISYSLPLLTLLYCEVIEINNTYNTVNLRCDNIEIDYAKPKYIRGDCK